MKNLTFNFLKVAFMGLIIFMTMSTTHAATLTVGITGCDYLTIQDAINAASPGDVIDVTAGTYPETLDLLSKQLTIIGAGNTLTIIDAAGIPGYAISNFGNGSLIQDVQLINSQHYGFKLSGVNNVSLTDILVEASAKTGVDLNGCDNCTLTNIEVNNTPGGFGLNIVDSDDITVDGITTTANAWGGVSIQSYGGSYTGGCNNITFQGIFSAAESTAFLIEQDPDGGIYYPITNVTVPAIFNYITYGFRSGDDYKQWIYKETLTGAKSVADGMASSASFTFLDIVVYNLAETDYYVTNNLIIQDAIDAATAGDVIHVDAGTYSENLSVDKHIDIIGAEDLTSGTPITNLTSADGNKPLIAISASGNSSTDPLLIKNFHVQTDITGIYHGSRTGIDIGTGPTGTGFYANIKIENVTVVGNFVNSDTESGFRVYGDKNLDNLVIEGCTFEDLNFGILVGAITSGSPGSLTNVTISNTTLHHNTIKGIYTEMLSDAVLSDLVVTENGSQSIIPGYLQPWGCGIDINLKYNDYENILLENITCTGNGLDAKEGVGITVKGRGTGNDNASYMANPATVDNVQVLGCTITGNERGIRFGEPGKDNTTPTNVEVHNCHISNNTQHYTGSDGSAYGGLINATAIPNLIDASCNWWGSTDPTVIAADISGLVIWSPFLVSSDLTNPDCSGYAPVTNLTTLLSYITIQAAVDAASTGDVLHIISGNYTENVTTVGKGGLGFALGNSPGCVTITGDLTLTSSDVFDMEIEGLTACTEHDKLIVTGTLDWNDATVNLILGSYNPLSGSVFTLFESSTLTNFTPTTIYNGSNGFQLAVDPGNPGNIQITSLNAIDIAVYEIGCASFEVMLRPNFAPDDNGITNVQFTVKYPETINLTDLVAYYGLLPGSSLPAAGGYEYITYVVANLPNTGWLADEEYLLLSFKHDQSSTTTVSDDFVILPDNEATITTQYYAEYLGSDVSGNIYANASNAVLTGCPVWNETQDIWYYQIQAAIDEADDINPAADVVRVYNVVPNNGVFEEDIVIDRHLSLYGPNVGINPNTGTRLPEAVIHPATIATDWEMPSIDVQSSDVTIDGFTLDGDNPNLNSGVIGVNGADLDAAEAISVYVDNVENLTVANNIIKNTSILGVFIYATSAASPATSGHLIDQNYFEDLGTYSTVNPNLTNWGIGAVIYNHQYARITDNVMNNVRVGIQTGVFQNPNPGDPMYQVIDGNAIQTRKRGIFFNYLQSNTSALTVSNNTITGIADANESYWIGILMATQYVTSQIASYNDIDGTGISVPSRGYDVWNVDELSPAMIEGGIIQNVDYGVFANNYEGYSSNGTHGAHAVVTGMTITPNAGGYGFYLKDSPDYTGAATTIEVEAYNNKISGGDYGIFAEENNSGWVSGTFNDNSITANSSYGMNSTVSNQLNASCNWWGSADVNSVAAEVNGDVLYMPFLVTDTENSPSAYPDGFDPAGPCASALSMKLWLQGPYDVTLHEMTPDINGELPASQPFNQAPWNYFGTETLPSPLSADVVDWVLVEARTDASTAFEQAAGLLYRDGSVTVNFSNLDQATDYHFVVYQRNHMPVMTAAPVSIDTYTFPYDFTVSSNLYGTPADPAAIELETDIWGMIAGDVTANGLLQYSGPGNDRGPILATIIAGGGVLLNATLSPGYWFEDVNMNNELMYLGTGGDDRAIILANLNTLTDPTYLNTVYTSVVPGAYTGTKSGSLNDGPVNIEINDGALSLTTTEDIHNGIIDNIQFTLAWKGGDREAEEAVGNFASEYGLLPMGDAINVCGESHQVFVSINITELPAEWHKGQRISIMQFTNLPEDRVWVADNSFTENNNAMYYISVWGKDYTGNIKQGIANSGNKLDLRVYPNPVNNGILNVIIPSDISGEAHVQIIDMQGGLQFDEMQNAASGIIKINASELQTGVYMILLAGEHTQHQARFIISK